MKWRIEGGDWHEEHAELDGSDESRSRNGRSITVRREWDRDDRDGWPDAARWIKDQADRLGVIGEGVGV